MVAMPAVVTFISDFGSRDAYVAQVKAAIVSGAGPVTIVDITHEMDPFDVIGAGWLLFTSYRFFPAGTVHLAVVDPGVGTDRAVLVARKDGHVFVGPDNGIFSFIYPADDLVEVTWRPETGVCPTFHARDLLAPIVVKIVTGHGLGVPGVPKDSPVIIPVDKPMVVHVDRFGNVITNIDATALEALACLEICGTRVSLLSRTYAQIPQGSLALVAGGSGTIEVAANCTRASDILDVRPGTPVTVHTR